MTHLDKLRFEEMGRECVRRYGTQTEVAEMCARLGEPVPEKPAAFTNAVRLKAEILRAHGHGQKKIAKALGLKDSVIREWMYPRRELAA